MSKRPLPLITLLCLATLACGDTGATARSYPLLATGAAAPSRMIDGYRVELQVAELAFGPLYLCATAGASADLCPSALAEFSDSAPIDLLDPEPQLLGRVEALSGEVRSATYDYGITWLNTQRTPTPTRDAVDGHSLHMEGSAERDGKRFEFVVDLDLSPKYQGSRAVQGARIPAQTQRAVTGLTIGFDPLSWWTGVDFEQLSTFADASESTGPMEIAVDSRAGSALIVAITATSPPLFTWSTD